MTELLEKALKYAERGWHVFPVKLSKTPLTRTGFRAASTNELQIRAWWRRWPTAGIGIATGQVSNLVVLDIDLDKPGAEASLAQIINDQGQFDDTVVVRTGGGGLHYYFTHPGPDRRVSNAQRLFGLIGIDVRGDGGYVIAPPSNHTSGQMYQWENGSSPEITPIADCPQFIYDDSSRTSLSFDLISPIPAGERNATLASIAGLLRSFGLDQVGIEHVLLSQNESRCEPPLEETEVKSIATFMAQYPPRRNRSDSDAELNPALETLLTFPQNDFGFAQMIALAHAGTLKYNFDTKRWLIWETHWWKIDRTGEIIQKTIEATELFRQAAGGIESDERRENLLRYGSRIQNRGKIDSAISICQTLPGIATRHDVWNTQSMKLPATNGIIDLETGSLLSGEPEDLLSYHLSIDYDSHASCSRWFQFLDEVFVGNSEIISFVQKAVGYSLTGRNDEQCLFLLVGSGANGKSVFLSTLRYLLGDFGVSLPFSTFLRNAGATVSNDLALLSGRRVAIASEANEGASFDEARIKAVTGGEPISARYLYSEFFEFRPQSKIWLGVNHLPTVRDDSEGFWRRVRRIDFPRQFEIDERDPQLVEKLLDELPGILAWAVEGTLQWLSSGLEVPRSIVDATKQYRDRSDPLLEFYEGACFVGDQHRTHVDEMYRHYKEWGIAKLLKPYELLSTSRFRARVERNFPIIKGESKRYYSGIGIKTTSAIQFSEKTSRKLKKPTS